jgi:hypothetical protein
LERLYDAIETGKLDLGEPAGVKEVGKLFQTKAKVWVGLVAGGGRRRFVRKMTAQKSVLAQNTPDFGKAYGGYLPYRGKIIGVA